jgi:pimeloyl-ACP methyl ester carboxylesterase
MKFHNSPVQKNPFPVKPENLNSGVGKVLMKPFTITIKRKRYQLDFGTITVPENRNIQNRITLVIPILRWHSRNNNPSSPIFWLGSGFSSSLNNLSSELNMLENEISWLFGHHDVILIGYRGICALAAGKSQEIGHIFKQEINPISGQDFTGMKNAFKHIYRHLEKMGMDTEVFGVAETAEDLEMVRNALGYKKINFVMLNYGIHVYLKYARTYPDNISQTYFIEPNGLDKVISRPDIFFTQLNA